jgi:AsmA protein
LDNTRFIGEAGLRSLSPLQFNAILAGDRLILDDYLAPASDATADSLASNKGTTDAVSPLAGLAAIDGDLRLELAQLEASGLKAERIEIAAEIRDRRIHLTQLAADLYEGQLLGQAVLNGRTAVPSMSADLSLTSLQIQGLLSDLADFSDLSGMTGFQANLAAEGLDAQSIMASLNGNASGEILNGGYKGIAIDSLICDGIATLTGGQSKLASGDTAFDAVRFNADIANGVAKFDTLKAGLVNLAVDGSGQVDLAGQRLNLVLDAGLTGDQQITGCAVPSFVQNAKLPLKCQGGFADDPAGLCGFDSSRADSLISEQLKAVAKAKEDELKAKTKAKIESKKDEFEAKLKEKAAEKLKSLFR